MKTSGLSSLFLAVTAVAGAALQPRNSCAKLPGNIKLVNETKLPDPFHFLNGRPVKTKRDWTCRQEELSSLFQKYELGTKPGAPDRLTTSLHSYNATKSNLSLTATEAGKSITWSVNITYPSTGKGPFPAIVAFDALTIPNEAPEDVAIVLFVVDDLAQQNNKSSRGVGKFYDLYGHDATASALMAWAWGTSRLIDAFEKTPAARINPRKVAVTGCSRDGKGAMVSGAFDNRVALTIVQESGSGGAACWRTSDAENNGTNTVQTASEIVQENVWFSTEFEVFANSTVNLLPFDHHELAGLIAPRGLYVMENLDFLWLGPEAAFNCMSAGHKIYEALGASSNFGFSQVGNHSHCQFPQIKQGGELTAFVDKFLLNEYTNTAVFRTEANYTFDASRWIDWKTPRLC